MNDYNLNIDANKELDNKYLIFSLKSEKYAFSIRNIKEIIIKPSVNFAPNLPPFYLGMTKLRNDILPIISLRKRLSYETVDEENSKLKEQLKIMKDEHLEWIDTLEHSIANGTEFRLQRDPHQCSFGKWYYSFKSDSSLINSILRKFEDPHVAIHKLANESIEIAKKEGIDAAVKHLSHAKSTTMKMLLSLFNELQNNLDNLSRETTIVFIDANGKQYGFVVDNIDKIIEISPDQIEIPSEYNEFSDYLVGIGKMQDDFYLIFDESKLI